MRHEICTVLFDKEKKMFPSPPCLDAGNVSQESNVPLEMHAEETHGQENSQHFFVLCFAFLFARKVI